MYRNSECAEPARRNASREVAAYHIDLISNTQSKDP